MDSVPAGSSNHARDGRVRALLPWRTAVGGIDSKLRPQLWQVHSDREASWLRIAETAKDVHHSDGREPADLRSRGCRYGRERDGTTRCNRRAPSDSCHHADHDRRHRAIHSGDAASCYGSQLGPKDRMPLSLAAVCHLSWFTASPPRRPSSAFPLMAQRLCS